MSAQQTNDRTLAAVGVVVALVVAHASGVASSLEAPERLQTVHDVASWVGGLLGLAGTVMAARAFSPGDYLRRAWSVRATASGLLLVGTALRSYWMHAQPDVSFNLSPLLPVRALLVVGANVAAALFLVQLALTYKRSGLQPPNSPRTLALWGLSALAAFALSLPHLLESARHLGEADGASWVAVVGIASTLGDLATILLVVPLLRVAYLLRGGRLAWVWWVMAGSGAAWLVYDAREWLAPLLPGNAQHTFELLLVLRSLGLGLMGLAGWLQRAALTPQPREAASPTLDVSGAV